MEGNSKSKWRNTMRITLVLCLLSCICASECEHMLGCIACSESPPQLQQAQQPGVTSRTHIEQRGSAIRAGSRSQGSLAASGPTSSPSPGAAAQQLQAAGGEQLLPRPSRGLLSVLDGGIARLFKFNKAKQRQAPKSSTLAGMQAAAAVADSYSGSSSSSNSMGQRVSTSAAQHHPSQQGHTSGTVPLQVQQPGAGAGAGPAVQPFVWPSSPGDAAAGAAYVHSWQPASAPGLAAGQASLRPPAQAFMQAPQQPLTVLTTDPKDHSAPHPWDVILFKTTQFNTTRPAYRLGGLGLMLMTDFNNTKPLTDWHVLAAADPHAGQQLQAMQGSVGGNRGGVSGVSTASFVEGRSLVKPGLANVQQPARPVAGGLHHAAAAAAAAAGGAAGVQMHTSHLAPQALQQQQQQQQQQRHAAAVGVASVGGGGGSSASAVGSTGLKATLARFKPESMVAQLKSALQRNMRMSAPGHTPAQEHSSSSSSSSSSISDLLTGGITEVEMQPTQLWCIACQEPAYKLSPLGYCVCAPGHGRLMDAASPYSCVRCPPGHISAMNNTRAGQQQQQQQPVAVQTCRPCPEGQSANDAQTACVVA